MQILVDADACPTVIRDIIIRAAIKREVKTLFVANHIFPVGNSSWVSLYQVPRGFDEADNEIVQRVEPGDLVITSDIPLAADVLEKGGHVITSRGERYTSGNIKQRLQMRDFMETMRSSATEQPGGPPALSQVDRKAFSDQFDRIITRELSKRADLG